MPKITVLPHESVCPGGKTIDTAFGQSIAQTLLDHDVELEHACGLVCACTTCHVIVREGFASLPASDEDEDDMLDKAWGLTPLSRLACQARIQNADLVIEIPKYSINHAKES